MPTIADIRAKFPQYQDVPDGELVRGLHNKFYKDMPYAEFLRGIDFREKVDPTADMSGMQKFNAGMGKAFTDIGTGASQMVGMGPNAEEVQNRRELDKPLMATGAGMGGNVAGNIAALAPLAMVPGAATVPGALALGAAGGALQPATGTAERLKDMLIGGAIGGGIQAAPFIPQAIQATGRALHAAQEPLSESGRQQIMGRVLNRFAGEESPAVAQRLAAAKELVPGSAPTAGQAAGNAGIAALERTASATQPAVMELQRQQLAAQNAARIGALEQMAGRGGRAEAMTAIRDSGADEMYGAARALGVRPEAAQSLQPQIKNLMERVPAGVKEKAAELARMNGETLGAEGSITGLHWMKQAVDDLISGARATGIGDQTKRALLQYKGDLLTVIDDLSPAYGQARQSFAEMSRIPNQMAVAERLADKSINPLTGTLQPQAFARNLSDQTAAAATGFKPATLAGTMEPAQMASLEAIKQDLARANFAQTAGRGVGSDTVQKMAMANLLDRTGAQRIPTLLNRPAMLANWMLERVYGGADKDMSRKLAEALLRPQEAAQLMQGVRPEASPWVSDVMRRKLSMLARSVAPGAAAAAGSE